MAVNFDDPCTVLAALRAAHLDLLTGKSVASLTYEGRTVSYSRGDIAGLERAISIYETKCAAASGKRTRYAIRAGGI